MIRAASPEDLPAIRALCAAASDAPYDLAVVAEEKCFAPGIAGEPVARLFEHNDKIKGMAVTCGKWLRLLAVDRNARRQGIGTALLRDAEQRGATVIAVEPGNYFTPGVVATDQATVGFLTSRGYSPGSETHNLHVALDNLTTRPPDNIKRASHNETAPLLSFIQREFGPIWRFEASRGNLLYLEHEGEIAGFAAWDANNKGLGWFGPTGVAKTLRGRGHGRQLLLATLDAMSARYDRAIIPWTDALDFYRKSCGAIPAHRFIAFTRRQP